MRSAPWSSLDLILTRPVEQSPRHAGRGHLAWSDDAAGLQDDVPQLARQGPAGPHHGQHRRERRAPCRSSPDPLFLHRSIEEANAAHAHAGHARVRPGQADKRKGGAPERLLPRRQRAGMSPVRQCTVPFPFAPLLVVISTTLPSRSPSLRPSDPALVPPSLFRLSSRLVPSHSHRPSSPRVASLVLSSFPPPCTLADFPSLSPPDPRLSAFPFPASLALLLVLFPPWEQLS